MFPQQPISKAYNTKGFIWRAHFKFLHYTVLRCLSCLASPADFGITARLMRNF